MQNVIPPSSSYAISDRLTWSIYETNVSQNLTTLDLTVTPTLVFDTYIESGILKPLSSQAKLILEQSIGIQLTEDVYKIFLRNTNFDLKAYKHILKMFNHQTNFGREMPLVDNYFKVLTTPRKANSENWVTIYKLS